MEVMCHSYYFHLTDYSYMFHSWSIETLVAFQSAVKYVASEMRMENRMLDEIDS